MKPKEKDGKGIPGGGGCSLSRGMERNSWGGYVASLGRLGDQRAVLVIGSALHPVLAEKATGGMAAREGAPGPEFQAPPTSPRAALSWEVVFLPQLFKVDS